MGDRGNGRKKESKSEIVLKRRTDTRATEKNADKRRVTNFEKRKKKKEIIPYD